MLSTHDDVLNWLAKDERNVEIFIKRLRKIVNEKIVLISDKFNRVSISIIRADQKHSRARR